MSRSSSLLSGFLVAITALSTSFCVGDVAAQARSAFAVDRVVSCQENLSDNTLTLTTDSGAALPPPSIQYLPGADGENIMVADFAGLVWTMEPKIVRLESGVIEEVRVGQFQESPPVLRFSITAKNPSLFKTVSFRSSGKGLTIKWSNRALPTAPRRSSGDLSYAPVSQAQSAYVPYAYKPIQPRKSTGSTGTVNSNPVSAPEPPIAFSPHLQIATKDQDHDLSPAPAPDSDASAPSTASCEAVPAPTPKGETSSSKSESGNDESSHNRSLFSRLLSKLTREDEQTKDQSKDYSKDYSKDQAGDQKFTQAETNKHSSSPSATTISKGNTSIDTDPAVIMVKPVANKDGKGQRDSKVAPPVKNTAINVISSDDSVAETLRIDITSPHALRYRAFRVHDPERYVVDFPGFRELTSVPPPESDSPLFYEIRTGKLPDQPNITRCVVDLPDTEVVVYDQLNPEKDVLSLTLVRKPVAWSVPVNGPLRPSGSMCVVLDAGHGGSDPGAQRGDIQEKDITLGIVQKLKKILESSGTKVVMTRSDDTFVSLEDRTRLTNQVNPDLFLSVHINALESTSDIKGIETYYQTDQSKVLADSIHQSLVSGLNAPDRNVRKARFYVINHTGVPAVLAEVGFISNKEEREKLASPDYQEKVAEALAQGVVLYVAKRPLPSDLAQSKSTSSGVASTPSSGSAGQGTMDGYKKSSGSSLVDSNRLSPR